MPKAFDVEPIMDTTAVDAGTARAIEAAEAGAGPTSTPRRRAGGPQEPATACGRSAVRWSCIGRRPAGADFSRAIGLGVAAPATRDAIGEILALWDGLGIEMFLLQSLPHCAPAAYEGWLRERGLEPFDAQDRIVRGGAPLVTAPDLDGQAPAVERVTPATADEWPAFLQRTYGLDTGPRRPALIGRPGWHQYVARDTGEIVAARGMHLGPDRVAWLGMDGPVPGS